MEKAALHRMATSIAQLTLCQVASEEIETATKLLEKRAGWLEPQLRVMSCVLTCNDCQTSLHSGGPHTLLFSNGVCKSLGRSRSHPRPGTADLQRVVGLTFVLSKPPIWCTFSRERRSDATRQLRQLSCILDSCTISTSYEVSQHRKRFCFCHVLKKDLASLRMNDTKSIMQTCRIFLTKILARILDTYSKLRKGKAHVSGLWVVSDRL